MDPAPASPADRALREALAARIARAFLAHLDEELRKSPAVLDRAQFRGRPAREIGLEVRERLLRRFPGIGARPAPPWNLFRRWAEVDGQVRYEDFSFEAYHWIFLARVEDLLEGTEASRGRFLDVTWDVFSAYDYREKGFSVTFFLDSENNMRELLRALAEEDRSLPAAEAWALVNAQSRAYQMTVYRFFEHLLKEEFARTDALLDNILPRAVKEELKATGRVTPVDHPHVAVLFTDFVEFAARSSRTPPAALIADLNALFTGFDEVMSRHGCERIKTIGDAYLAVCGLPTPVERPVPPLLRAAIDMLGFLESYNRGRPDPWRIRIGIALGPVVGAVVGVRKYIYDVFGDTVNTAARMEQLCEPMRIHVTEEVARAAPHDVALDPRGPLPVKGKGTMTTFYARPAAPGA